MGRNKNIPNHNMVPPGNGAAPKKTIQETEPVYSVYTGEQVWTGPMPYGIRCDAPKSDPNYGKNYHAIQYIPAEVPYWAAHMHIAQVSPEQPNIHGQIHQRQQMHQHQMHQQQMHQQQMHQQQMYQQQMGMGTQNQNLVHQMYQQMQNQMW